MVGAGRALRRVVADPVEDRGRRLRAGTGPRPSGRTGWWDEPGGRRWYTVWEAEGFAAAVEAAGFQVDELVAGVMAEVWATRAVPPASAEQEG